MKTSRLLYTITAFAIAMGFLEAAVVVYMREILYPGGFSFPLSPVPVSHRHPGSPQIQHGFCLVHIHFCHLGHLLLCIPEGHPRLARIIHDLGRALPHTHHLDRTGTHSGTRLTDHDSFCRADFISG